LFEAAGEGTLFLDEIGDLPIDLQAKLLRALQEREIKPVGSNERIGIRARVIAATNRDLKRPSAPEDSARTCISG
jgi:transcriptional regulator with GAF, ATPase, and Fis domain